MFWRRVWQRLGPVAQRVFTPTFRKAPVRRMTVGVPGGATNMTYFLLCGGGLTAAVVYAYRTVSGDIERYEDRLANMASTAEASSAEEVEATAEATPAEKPVSPAEVVAESVAVPAESAIEPPVESTAPEADAGVVSEVISAEDDTAAEEAAPPVALEEVAGDALVTPVVETPTEAPTAESAGTSVVDESLPPRPPVETGGAADTSA